MSLDITLTRIQPSAVYCANITHNLTTMAEAADIYKPLWRPEKCGITKAAQLIGPLTQALERMKAKPHVYSKYDSPNGWGLYANFVPWLERLLAACEAFPDANIEVSV